MRRVRRNAASKLDNGRCTSQMSAMSSRRASGESCAIAGLEAPRLLALESRKVDIMGGARAYRAGARPLRAPLGRCQGIGPSPARRDCVAVTPRQSRARLVPEAPGAWCNRSALARLRNASGRERPSTCMIRSLWASSAPRPAGDEGASRPSRCLWRGPLSDPRPSRPRSTRALFQAADSGRGELVRFVSEEAHGGSEADSAP